MTNSGSSSQSQRLNADAREFVPAQRGVQQHRRLPPPQMPPFMAMPPPSPPVMYAPPQPPVPPPVPPYFMPIPPASMPYGYFHHPGMMAPQQQQVLGAAEGRNFEGEAGRGIDPMGSAGVGSDDGASEKVVNQVEYYFSDINLATTDHLMKYIKKDAEGYVPISVVASFKKIKALISSSSQLATILRKSSKLVVSEDGKKVRRLHSLTETDIEQLQSRIVVAENLPEDHCYQNLMKVFSVVGSVKSIRTCPPQTSSGGGLSASKLAWGDNVLSNKLHAFVEYESPELAEKAVTELNDEGNWRSGLRVKLMHKHLYSTQSKASQPRRRKAHDGELLSEEEDVSTSEQHPFERRLEDSSQHSDSLPYEHPGEENIAEKGDGHKKGRSRGRGKGRGRAPLHENRGNHVGTTSSNLVENDPATIAKQPPGPRMPDGTRGFSMGRGKSVTVDIS